MVRETQLFQDASPNPRYRSQIILVGHKSVTDGQTDDNKQKNRGLIIWTNLGILHTKYQALGIVVSDKKIFSFHLANIFLTYLILD